ncbi:MAG TPA: HAD family hydrolase [Chitinivibrionales bacterium]|nr:HAD family hydrolase [Chitinivibrionales bacterium]
MSQKKKALFLDRDGVINEDSDYPHKPGQIVFNPGVFDLCLQAQEKGYSIVVVTNQAGVAKGRFTEADVQALHRWMAQRFLEKGITIAGFYYCPFHKNGTIEEYKKDSDCRKPKPGMFLKAAEDLDIDLSKSIMVGDKQSDRIELPELKCFVIKSRYSGDNYDFGDIDKVKDVL